MSIRTWIKQRIRNEAPFFDNVDAALIVGLGILIAIVAIVDSQVTFINGAYAIALVTAVSAFAVVYQMRHPRDKIRPAVRPDFELRNGGGTCDLGLRNFGPGPALYFQLEAVVGGRDEAILEPLDRPVHLPEGEFLGLFNDEVWKSEWDSTEEVIETLEKSESNEPQIEFYFTFVTGSGRREPSRLEVKPHEFDENILDRLKSEEHPRRMTLSEIEKNCT